MIDWVILLYGLICGIAGIVTGALLYKEMHEKEIAHLKNKIRFYESHNHYIYQDTAEAFREADLNEHW